MVRHMIRRRVMPSLEHSGGGSPGRGAGGDLVPCLQQGGWGEGERKSVGGHLGSCAQAAPVHHMLFQAIGYVPQTKAVGRFCSSCHTAGQLASFLLPVWITVKVLRQREGARCVRRPTLIWLAGMGRAAEEGMLTHAELPIPQAWVGWPIPSCHTLGCPTVGWQLTW